MAMIKHCEWGKIVEKKMICLGGLESMIEEWKHGCKRRKLKTQVETQSGGKESVLGHGFKTLKPAFSDILPPAR